VSSGSETPAPLPLFKPAHSDNETALWKSTVPLKKNLHDEQDVGKSCAHTWQLARIGTVQTTLMETKIWIK
jgi:hypothetical protein